MKGAQESRPSFRDQSHQRTEGKERAGKNRQSVLHSRPDHGLIPSSDVACVALRVRAVVNSFEFHSRSGCSTAAMFSVRVRRVSMVMDPQRARC